LVGVITLVNMVSGVAKNRKRKYNNSLRAKQAQATRAAILDAAEIALADETQGEFSMAQLAVEAGVSPATLFRHFPTKDALFAGCTQRAAERLQIPDVLSDLDGLRDQVHTLFGYFNENRALIGASRRLPEARRYAQSIRADRYDRIQRSLAKRYPKLSEKDRQAAAAVLQLVVSAQGWQWLVGACGLDQERAVEAAKWAFGTLLASLDVGQLAAVEQKSVEREE